MSRPTNRWE